MEEEARQEEIAAIIGALSAIDMQLQEVEKTAQERSDVFCEEAEQTDTPTSPQFNTAGHLLQELRSEVREIREYIDGLEEFLRTGEYTATRYRDIPRVKASGLLERTRTALENASISFHKASNALYVAGRALEGEDLNTYAEHLQNLSESVEVEARRARSVLESVEQEQGDDP